MTNEAADLKVMSLVEQARQLRKQRLAIQVELDERFDAWSRLADADHTNLGETSFHPREDELAILRPWPGGYAPPNRPSLHTVASLKRDLFDGASLWQLLADRESIRDRLTRIEAQLKGVGISI